MSDQARTSERLERIVVVGDGGWGTALALALARSGCAVTMWSHDSAYAEVMRAERANPRFLPGVELLAPIQITADLATAAGEADLLISAVPSAFLRDVWQAHASAIPADVPVLTVSKGLEQETLLRPSEVLWQILGADRSIGVLSGPNIAREVAAGLPAATVVAAKDPTLARRIQATFTDPAFRVYVNDDLPGVELGGVLKNVIALAAGMCDGLALGDNAKAALVTRGVIEMGRLGVAFGGVHETFFGLSGLGDLITTCTSPQSRNRTFGERIGRGEHITDIASGMHQVAEGVKSAKPVHDLSLKHGLELPISTEVYRVVHEARSPRESVRALMERAQRVEI